MQTALPSHPLLTEAPLLLVPFDWPAAPSAPPVAPGPSPHQVATEISDIRREIARLKQREARLLSGIPEPTRRPGWPMQRLPR